MADVADAMREGLLAFATSAGLVVAPDARSARLARRRRSRRVLVASSPHQRGDPSWCWCQFLVITGGDYSEATESGGPIAPGGPPQARPGLGSTARCAGPGGWRAGGLAGRRASPVVPAPGGERGAGPGVRGGHGRRVGLVDHVLRRQGRSPPTRHVGGCWPLASGWHGTTVPRSSRGTPLIWRRPQRRPAARTCTTVWRRSSDGQASGRWAAPARTGPSSGWRYSTPLGPPRSSGATSR